MPNKLKLVFSCTLLLTIVFAYSAKSELFFNSFVSYNNLLALNSNSTEEHVADISINPLEFNVPPFTIVPGSNKGASAKARVNRSDVGKVVNIEVANNNDNTRITFDITKDFSTQVRIINFPFRLMFDAPMPYEWAVPEKSLENPALIKVVSSIRYGHPDNDTFRVIANLKYPVNINRVFLIPDNTGNKSFKFVVDLRQSDMLTTLLNSSTVVIPQTREYYARLEQNAFESQKLATDNKREVAVNRWIDSYLQKVDYPAPIIQSSGGNNKKIIVVIDPGHGGKDPGAMPSPDSNIREKDIVLNIGKLVTAELIKNPNIAVVLTRRGDYFVPLKDRILWAKRFNADLFVSIHADRAPSEDSAGLSVYTLSQNASDVQTQVIATDQNKSDVIAGLSDNEDNEVSRILINLLQRVKINDSVALAQAVLGSASQNINLLPNPMRSAGFMVLQVPETPSILIETGFLSNTKDTKNLSDSSYQKLVASKIANGIENYLLNSAKIKKLPSDNATLDTDGIKG